MQRLRLILPALRKTWGTSLAEHSRLFASKAKAKAKPSAEELREQRERDRQEKWWKQNSPEAVAKRQKETQERAQSLAKTQAILHGELLKHTQPITSDPLWLIVKDQGIKSKRYMKQVLQLMKKSGWVSAKKAVGTSNFGYILPELRRPKTQRVQPQSADASSSDSRLQSAA